MANLMLVDEENLADDERLRVEDAWQKFLVKHPAKTAVRRQVRRDVINGRLVVEFWLPSGVMAGRAYQLPDGSMELQ